MSRYLYSRYELVLLPKHFLIDIEPPKRGFYHGDGDILSIPVVFYGIDRSAFRAFRFGAEKNEFGALTAFTRTAAASIHYHDPEPGEPFQQFPQFQRCPMRKCG